jgi:hypothetical protein
MLPAQLLAKLQTEIMALEIAKVGGSKLAELKAQAAQAKAVVNAK